MEVAAFEEVRDQVAGRGNRRRVRSGDGELGGGRNLWGREMIGSGETGRWWGGTEPRCTAKGRRISRKIRKTVVYGDCSRDGDRADEHGN